MPEGGNPHLRRPENPRPPLKPWERLEIVRLLALGELTHGQIGERMDGRTQQLISQFAKNHAGEVEQVRAANGDALAGLWIARKQDRLTAYADMHERLMETVEKVDPETGEPFLEGPDAAGMRVAATMLRNAAEELGQLPNRVTLAFEQPLEIRLVGVDTEDLT